MTERVVADHNVKEAILDQLERLEIANVVRLRSVNLQRASDPDILAWAAEHDLPVLSQDIETMPGFAYARIAAGLPMPGLILVHQWVPIGHALDDLYDIFVRGLPGGLVNTVRFIPLSPGSP